MKVKVRSTQALLLGAVALVAVISFAAVAVGATTDTDPSATSSESTVNAVQVSTSTLSEAEIDGILFMREEEKLAYDVYMTFADLYGQPIFSNIASAEDKHMTAVYELIVAYGLDDPVDDSPIGTFQNAELQELYDGLIADGSVNVAAAFEMAAIIEEVDILDLEQFLAETTNTDIIRVYENLLRGSENHLRAFVSQLESAGVNRDDPTHMDKAAYGAILESEMQRGGSSESGHDGAGHGDEECDESGQGRHGDDHDDHGGQGQGAQDHGGQGQGAQGKGGQGGQGMRGQNG